MAKAAQGRGIGAQRIGAIKRAGARESESIQALREWHRVAHTAQTLKLLPQPQVVFAFGLRITNCAPVSDST